MRFGVFTLSNFQNRRHEIDQMNRRTYPAVTFGNPLGPIGDKGTAIPTLMIEMLVHPQGRVAQTGPSAAHGMIGSRPTHALQFISFVQLSEAFATALIETKWAPLVAGSIVTGEKKKGILKISTLFKK